MLRLLGSGYWDYEGHEYYDDYDYDEYDDHEDYREDDDDDYAEDDNQYFIDGGGVEWWRDPSDKWWWWKEPRGTWSDKPRAKPWEAQLAQVHLVQATYQTQHHSWSHDNARERRARDWRSADTVAYTRQQAVLEYIASAVDELRSLRQQSHDIRVAFGQMQIQMHHAIASMNTMTHGTIATVQTVEHKLSSKVQQKAGSSHDTMQAIDSRIEEFKPKVREVARVTPCRFHLRGQCSNRRHLCIRTPTWSTTERRAQ